MIQYAAFVHENGEEEKINRPSHLLWTEVKPIKHTESSDKKEFGVFCSIENKEEIGQVLFKSLLKEKQRL